jgi:hypothetical protein
VILAIEITVQQFLRDQNISETLQKGQSGTRRRGNRERGRERDREREINSRTENYTQVCGIT